VDFSSCCRSAAGNRTAGRNQLRRMRIELRNSFRLPTGSVKDGRRRCKIRGRVDTNKKRRSILKAS